MILMKRLAWSILLTPQFSFNPALSLYVASPAYALVYNNNAGRAIAEPGLV